MGASLSFLVGSTGPNRRRLDTPVQLQGATTAYQVLVWEGMDLVGEEVLYTVQRVQGADSLLMPDRMLSESPCASSLQELRVELECYFAALSLPKVVMRGAAYKEWLPPCVLRYRDLAALAPTRAVLGFRVGRDEFGRYAVYRVLNQNSGQHIVVTGPWTLVARSEDELRKEMTYYQMALETDIVYPTICAKTGHVLRLRV